MLLVLVEALLLLECLKRLQLGTCFLSNSTESLCWRQHASLTNSLLSSSHSSVFSSSLCCRTYINNMWTHQSCYYTWTHQSYYYMWTHQGYQGCSAMRDKTLILTNNSCAIVGIKYNKLDSWIVVCCYTNNVQQKTMTYI